MSSAIFLEFLAILIYLIALACVAIFTYKKQSTETDFIIGARSMNFWLTALAAHASDMSSWLFMGYPATIFAIGLHQAWAGIGLWIFMLLNWQFIAPKVRIETEKTNSLTFSTFFEKKLKDNSGVIRVFTAIMLFVFYTIYISAALVGMGLVLNTLFNVPYELGIIIGILIVVPYVFFGGYLTLASIDLFQGMFLLAVIIFVPIYLFPKVGGAVGIQEALVTQRLTHSLIPNFKFTTIAEILFLAAGWGLGYFGQPHIITKFMGIKKVSEIWKSKIIGMSWMFLALGAATLVGLVGVAFFNQGLEIDSEVFIEMVKRTFPPFLTGLILCAVFAATINAISSMVLVLTSSLAEDIYKKLLRPKASHKELLLISRFGVVLIAAISYIIAAAKISTIYGLVLYAWSGLGSSFGPLLILCLYMKGITKYGAWTGILAGGLISALWPLVEDRVPLDIPPLPPAFLVSFLLIWVVSKKTQKRIAA